MSHCRRRARLCPRKKLGSFYATWSSMKLLELFASEAHRQLLLFPYHPFEPYFCWTWCPLKYPSQQLAVQFCGLSLLGCHLVSSWSPECFHWNCFQNHPQQWNLENLIQKFGRTWASNVAYPCLFPAVQHFGSDRNCSKRRSEQQPRWASTRGRWRKQMAGRTPVF